MSMACFINILMLVLLLAAAFDRCYCILVLGAVPASFCWLLKVVLLLTAVTGFCWQLAVGGCS